MSDVTKNSKPQKSEPQKFGSEEFGRIKDSDKGHWVNRSPMSVRPYLQLSRLDRPVGYWLLTLPGWIGLAFAALSHGLAVSDVTWAVLILIGAIAMRGAGCTYNDIIDQDLDAQVERTALRPLPAGTVASKQAWAWLFAQCFIGLLVLLCLPRLAQYMSLASIPLVAAYPFMKRITWFPQVWLGMTFNWAVLVAYATKTGTVSSPLFILYAGLIFWTIGYDTIYACQDIEDDMKIGVKSTARKFGSRVKLGVGICYGVFLCLLYVAMSIEAQFEYIPTLEENLEAIKNIQDASKGWVLYPPLDGEAGRTERYLYISKYAFLIFSSPLALHLFWQLHKFKNTTPASSLRVFKSNIWAGGLVIISFYLLGYILTASSI